MVVSRAGAQHDITFRQAHRLLGVFLQGHQDESDLGGKKDAEVENIQSGE
jgi:hypothetical protein